MTAVWALAMPHADKIVLLALADNANDEGYCYPSASTLSRKCGMNERSIRRIVERLQDMGHVTQHDRPGRSSTFDIHPGRTVTPDGQSPRTLGQDTPDRPSPTPRTVSPSTPDRPSPITIIEPSIEPSGNHQGGIREPGPVEKVFEHWTQTHRHPQAKLDAKRRKVIVSALKDYSEAALCQAITGYLNSPHHMGQNDRATMFDDIELFLRDAKHIDAGIKFHAQPPRADQSALTRRNVAAVADWQPPELRNATK